MTPETFFTVTAIILFVFFRRRPIA